MTQYVLLIYYESSVRNQYKPKKTKDAFAFGPKSPYIRPSLKIRGTEENIFVDGLSWHTITSADEAEKWLAKGNAKRATASTGIVFR